MAELQLLAQCHAMSAERIAKKIEALGDLVYDALNLDFLEEVERSGLAVDTYASDLSFGMRGMLHALAIELRAEFGAPHPMGGNDDD
jgi:hypothetical protein